MSFCKKTTITNTGKTQMSFNYQNCSDSVWKYNVTLDPNQTKTLFVVDGTEMFRTTDVNNLEVQTESNFLIPECVSAKPVNEIITYFDCCDVYRFEKVTIPSEKQYNIRPWNFSGMKIVGQENPRLKPCEKCCDPLYGWESYNDTMCVRISVTTPTIPSNELETNNYQYEYYTINGVKFMSDDYNLDGSGNVEYELHTYVSGLPEPYYEGTLWANPQQLPYDGPLNRCGVWQSASQTLPLNTWLGFSICVNNLTIGKTYYLGISADNHFRVVLNGQDIINTINGSLTDDLYKWWFVYPIVFYSDEDTLQVYGLNSDVASVASIGCEIYDNELNELVNATSLNDLTILYTTKSEFVFTASQSYDGEPLLLTARCPEEYVFSSCNRFCKKYEFCQK